MPYKLFSLDEARKLIPILHEILTQANEELSAAAEAVHLAAEQYAKCEDALDNPDNSGRIDDLRLHRQQFATAIDELAKAQQAYLQSFNYWVEKVTVQGVILRDLKEGLLDFPARENGFDYLLCWQMSEADINFWHLHDDGFIGRKPLAALLEYS